MAATPINISRVVEDDTIVKETIQSTGGYRINLLRVDQLVVLLLHFNRKWRLKYCAAELRVEIDHLYILPVSAPGISAAASTSSTNTPTSTPTKQLNTRLTEINFD